MSSIDFSKRALAPEKLDGLQLDASDLHQILADLEWINKFLGNYWAIQKAIRPYIDETEVIKIVDLGCGSGGLLRHLARVFNQKKVHHQLIGVDFNPVSIAFAAEKSKGFEHIAFQVSDIMDESFEPPACDILISSHFMYHFEDIAFAAKIRKWSKTTTKALIISELERKYLAHWLFNNIAPKLNLHPITIQDGLTAIRGAFTKDELLAILRATHFTAFTVEKPLLFRLITTIHLEQTIMPSQ